MHAAWPNALLIVVAKERSPLEGARQKEGRRSTDVRKLQGWPDACGLLSLRLRAVYLAWHGSFLTSADNTVVSWRSEKCCHTPATVAPLQLRIVVVAVSMEHEESRTWPGLTARVAL